MRALSASGDARDRKLSRIVARLEWFVLNA
jgi:hypothetical protein